MKIDDDLKVVTTILGCLGGSCLGVIVLILIFVKGLGWVTGKW